MSDYDRDKLQAQIDELTSILGYIMEHLGCHDRPTSCDECESIKGLVEDVQKAPCNEY